MAKGRIVGGVDGRAVREWKIPKPSEPWPNLPIVDIGDDLEFGISKSFVDHIMAYDIWPPIPQQDDPYDKDTDPMVPTSPTLPSAPPAKAPANTSA